MEKSSESAQTLSQSLIRKHCFGSIRLGLLTPEAHVSSTLPVMSRVDEWAAILMRYIRAKIEKEGETINLGEVMAYFQVDLVSSVELGKAWGNLSQNTDTFGFLRMGETVVPAVQSISYLPTARAIYTSQWFMKLFGPKKTDTSGLGLFQGVLEKEVEHRFNNKEKPDEARDILSEWMKTDLSAEECQLDLSLLMPAGTETSIMTIRGTLLLLMSSPAIYRKLKQEIKDGIASGIISSPVSNEEAKSLEYMQAVLRESMRLMAPINFGFPKRVPASGDTICGKYLPPGTDVYANIFRMMHSKEVFGTDADLFRPERFLESELDVKQMVKVVDLVFGGGRFVCLGKALAMIELNKIFIEANSKCVLTLFPQLLRNFDFQIAMPEKPWERIGYDYGMRITAATV
ncbi:hypothetical protein ONZ43_g4599 [Nemania bipapillata]|uniref:Uncharacterized protein n=1 Tax=Nemania bipapillata TaxID=110536 RepID=A0ACC2IKN6_9PEZI|nr:hypothetical protein ONZ43_g4599 [Nemania bipapillata]